MPTCNCADLQQNTYDKNLYSITDIYYKENPCDNLPEGWQVVAYETISFQLMVTEPYSICNVNFAVFNTEAKPVYLVGEFQK